MGRRVRSRPDPPAPSALRHLLFLLPIRQLRVQSPSVCHPGGIAHIFRKPNISNRIRKFQPKKWPEEHLEKILTIFESMLRYTSWTLG